MLLQFTMDTTQRKDIELAKNTLDYMLGFIPQANAAQAALGTLGEIAKTAGTQAAQPTGQLPTADAPKPEVPKKEVKKKAVTVKAGEPIKVPEINALDFPAVKAKLQEYAEDPRYGMAAVNGEGTGILQRYGVLRVSALPKDRYEEFVKEINDALAAQPDPLA